MESSAVKYLGFDFAERSAKTRQINAPGEYNLAQSMLLQFCFLGYCCLIQCILNVNPVAH